MGIADHITCLLRNLCASQEATVRTRHGTIDWFKIGKGVHQVCTLSPYLFDLCAECIMWNARLDDSQTGIKIAKKNINNLRYAGDTTLTAESEEELKSVLMKVKEESEKAGLKLNIQKLKIMASGPIMSWQINAEKGKVVTDFIILGSRITADSDCSHEIKTHAPWKESYDKPRQHIKKQTHHFADKSSYRQSYDLSSSHVRMWDHKEVWAPKNWCFWTVVLEKTPESPLNCKIKPSNPKGSPPRIFIGRTDTEAEAPIVGPPDVKSWLTEKDPDAGNDWRQKEKGTSEDEVVGWHHWLNGHQFEQTPGEMFVYTRSIKTCASRFHELLESIVYLLVVVKAFSLQKVTEMLKEVVVGWREARWALQMRQNFVALFVQLFELFVVWPIVGCFHGEELGPLHWSMLATSFAVFSASHQFAKHTSQM